MVLSQAYGVGARSAGGAPGRPQRARAVARLARRAGVAATGTVVVVGLVALGPAADASGKTKKGPSPSTTTTTTPTTTSTTTTTSPTSTTTTTTPPADTTPPSLTVSSPVPGSTVSGSVSVTGGAADNVAVADVQVSVDSGAWQSATGTTSWSLSWSTTGLANGSHTLAARAVDSSGNLSAVVTLSVTVSNASSPPPDAQGTWVSPEGATIEVSSSYPWTISQVYGILKANALALGTIGPSLVLDVQDQYPGMTTTSATLSNGTYKNFHATIMLQGSSTGLQGMPDYTMSREYGVVWSQYYYFMVHQADWSAYLNQRLDGSTYNGTVCQYLGQDPRLGSTGTWDTREIFADDYRLLFGSQAAISQRPQSINTTITDPRNQPGLATWLLNTWA